MHMTRHRRFTLPLALIGPYGSPRSGHGAFATYQSPLHCSCFSPADAMTATIIILAGPNGAGKTTFARSFLPQEANCLRFLNADLIAAGLSPFAPEAAALKAGRLMLSEIEGCVQRRESFAFETTLSGLGYVARIRQWRSMGYEVSL
jgi:hypothetical protein